MTAELEIVHDWRVFATDQSLSAVATSGEEAVVTWSDGRETGYYRFFLRDNCSCSQCYLPLTREQ